MSFDIYGNNLRRGHCEVHPHVHEEYPCSVCLAESQRQAEHQPEYCDGDPRYCESAYYLGQASDRIKELENAAKEYRAVIAIIAREYDMGFSDEPENDEEAISMLFERHHYEIKAALLREGEEDA